MAGTLHMEIRGAVHGQLVAAIARGDFACDGGAHQGRRGRAVPEQVRRQIHVYLDLAQVDRAQLRGQPDDWTTRVRIECCARSDSAAQLTGELNADDLAASAYAAVLAEPTLNLPDSVMDVMPLGIKWDTEEGDAEVAVVQLAFDVRHRTDSAAIAAP